MKSLSASRSDESNLATLLKLAKVEGIHELWVVMPYELDGDQLERLRAKTAATIQNQQQDELLVRL